MKGHARNLMSEKVFAVTGDTPLAEIGRLFVLETVSGVPVVDVADQAALVWANISAMLGDADLAQSDIVSVTTYVVVGADLAPVMAARDAALGGHRAASTLVTVPALARPEWHMEIAVIAAR